jgi:beta-mannosidase
MLAACDRHGIAVWHDLMFSVLDYPSDEAFAAKCEIEVAQQTALMQSHPCVVTICGSAEVDQQAAMTGVALAETRHPLFHERLAATVRATLPSVPYWPSTPSGGVVPFRTDTGTAHYFGVGAYERGLDDARRSAVRFTTECLAFSHLPEPESPAAIALDDLNGRERWKARVPRDGGVGWDFEDTRDFYVGHLFGVDPARLRGVDPQRYLALGRAATAIVVERTMQELRRIASPCQGAITWLWADPWAGAGWGYVDATGRPKASWFGMRRALRPVALALTNEGMNGVDVHAWNDRPERMEGTLHVRLLRDGREVVRAASCALSVEGGQGVRLSVEEVLGHFVDVAHSYRFGPPSHDAVHAVWVCDATPDEGNGAESSSFEGHAVIDDAVLLVHGDARATTDTGLRVQLIDEDSSGDVIVSVTTSSLAQMIRIGSAAYRPSESYFTLVPGVERRLRLALIDPSAPRSVVAEALNDVVARRVTLGADASAAGAQSAGARSIDERHGASSLVGDAC